MRFGVGDEVVLKVNVGSDDRPRWERRKVQVIGLPTRTRDGQYICYVPQWLMIRNTFVLNVAHQSYYDFPDKFLGEQGYFITEHSQYHSIERAPEGSCCAKCGTFVRWAQPDETGTFRCRQCRENPYR